MPKTINLRTLSTGERRGARSLPAPKYTDWRNCDHCGGVRSVIRATQWQGLLCMTCGYKTFKDSKAKAKHDALLKRGK